MITFENVNFNKVHGDEMFEKVKITYKLDKIKEAISIANKHGEAILIMEQAPWSSKNC